MGGAWWRGQDTEDGGRGMTNDEWGVGNVGV